MHIENEFSKMYYTLSKREKKIAKACIDKGLDAEFKEGLELCGAVIDAWRAEKIPSNKEAYHQLFGVLKNKDKAIARRYDDLSGSRWLVTVTAQLHDGYLTEEDIQDFSEETKVAFKRMEVLFQ